jgi:hypothetical protein
MPSQSGHFFGLVSLFRLTVDMAGSVFLGLFAIAILREARLSCKVLKATTFVTVM